MNLSEQMKHRDRDMVPKVLVQAMFALMFASVALVAFAKFTDQPLTGVLVESPVVVEREVLLIGDRNTGITVTDLQGEKLAASSEDRAGFIDVIWMSTTRERKVNQVALDAPLRVVRRANGNTAVLDDTTGWSIELIGYGKDNIAAFAKLVD